MWLHAHNFMTFAFTHIVLPGVIYTVGPHRNICHSKDSKFNIFNRSSYSDNYISRRKYVHMKSLPLHTHKCFAKCL